MKLIFLLFSGVMVSRSDPQNKVAAASFLSHDMSRKEVLDAAEAILMQGL